MVDVDLSQLPFTLLDDTGREHVRRGMDLAYFDRDDIILEMGEQGAYVFLIHKGDRYAEIDPSLPAASAHIGHYTAGDLFHAH